MTKLLYLEDFDVVSCQAVVQNVYKHEGNTVVVLDQTCFYPKGGGQDFDTGTISAGDGATFAVEAVFYVGSEVKHVGSFTEGNFAVGDSVTCTVNGDRRALNTRLHSAGHVLDMAVRGLGYDWLPAKAAHLPHQCFVDYKGTWHIEQREQIITDIQAAIDVLLAKGSTNTIVFMSPADMKSRGAVVPDNLPTDKPSRVVLYDDFAVPCGGTHVANIHDIGAVTVSKIKNKDGFIRVSYSI